MGKKIQWGYIWKMKTEKLHNVVDQFWPTMGSGWTKQKCLDDIERCKKAGDIGPRAKPIIYRVILEEI